MHSPHLSFPRKSVLTAVALAGAAMAQTTPQSLPNSTSPAATDPAGTRPTTTVPSATNPNSSGQPIPGANPSANADNLAVSPGNSHLTPAGTQFIKDALTGGRHEVAMAHLGMSKASNPALKSYSQRLANDHSTANAKLESIADKNGIAVMGGADAHAGVLTASDSAQAGHGSLASTPTDRTNADRNNKGNQAALSGTAESAVHSSAAQASGTQVGSAVHSSTTVDSSESVHGSMDSHLSGLSGSDFDRAFAKQMVDDHERTIAKFESAQTQVTDTELRGFIASTLPTLRQHLEQARALAK